MSFNAYTTVNPHYMVPETLLQISQRSGAFRALPDGKQSVRLSEGDQYVYIKSLQMRGDANAGQSAANSLNGPAFVTKMVSAPTYLIRSRSEYDHHDTAAAGNWDVSLPEAYRRGTWQTFAQNERNALLYGFQPANGEGLMNTVGATATSLPADSNGNTTFVTYDNGELALFFLQTIVAAQIRMFLSAQGNNRAVILGPQRILSFMQKANIVQLVQFQRPGAGTDTTGGVIDSVLEGVGDRVEWAYDDTLIGKGAGGSDAVLIVYPELENQEGQTGPDTNAFGGLKPNLRDNTLQFTDMPAPRELIAPLPGGATDVTFEKRITPGWGVRPEAITILSIQYS